MLKDTYKSEINDDGFSIDSSSKIDTYILLIEKVVKVKDFGIDNGDIYFVPVSVGDMLAKKQFLNNLGFKIKDNHIIKTKD